jgi:SAM-dependent methyltransferase
MKNRKLLHYYGLIPSRIRRAKMWARERLSAFKSNHDPGKSLWTEQFETGYWRDEASNNYRELMGKLHTLRYFQFLQHLAEAPANVVDVGGGPQGGVLTIIGATNRKVLVDPLTPQSSLPAGIEHIKSLADEIAIESGTFDVVFCLEALDHCPDTTSFERSVLELARITRKSGLLFFEMPIRPYPINGHPISLLQFSRDDIEKLFRAVGCSAVFRYDYGPCFGSPPSFGLVMIKES